MKIRLITPGPTHALNGNRVTAQRWVRILRQLGHRPLVQQTYDGGPCDLMIALHARRSFESIQRFSRRHPDLPLIVVLTGTDLYRDIRTSRRAQRSLDMATKLIVLQGNGLEELPEHYRAKTRVIYQSAEQTNGRVSRPQREFLVCVVGHLRREKDPFRTAMAARGLPPSSRIKVLHVGRALTRAMERRARDEASVNSRYHWLGELPHPKTRRLLARSHLLTLTSRMEGSSNVLSEALACSVPVLASKISGLMGTLGEGYPGYYPVGNTHALRDLLQKAEMDAAFYQELKEHCSRLWSLIDPEREKSCWASVLKELNKRDGGSNDQ